MLHSQTEMGTISIKQNSGFNSKETKYFESLQKYFDPNCLYLFYNFGEGEENPRL